MNAPDALWRQWAAQLRACVPEVQGHRSTTVALFVLGVVLAGTTRLPRVAETRGGRSSAKTPSSERRLARLLAHAHLAVVAVWTRLRGQVLACWRARRLVFVLAAPALDARAPVVYLGRLVPCRRLAVSGQVLAVHEPWEQRQWDVVGALLDRVIAPWGAAECTLLAERGLVGHPLLQRCQPRGGQYVLRVAAPPTGQLARGRATHGGSAGRPLVPQRGCQCYGPVPRWQEPPLSAPVSARWDPAPSEPCIVRSDRPAGRQRVHAYALSMRSESTCQDRQRRGWDLQGTVLADRARLHRVLLVLLKLPRFGGHQYAWG